MPIIGSMNASTSVPTSSSRGEVRLRARALAGLFGAGASLALLTVLLPHPARAETLGLLVVVAIAYVVAGALWWGVNGRRGRVLPVALAWGSTLISAVAYFSAQTPSPLVFFYLWIFLYSAYFFTKRQAAVQMAFVSVAYAVLLMARPPASGGPAWWVVGMGTLLVAAILVAVMRDRGETLIAKLYDASRTDPLTELTNRRGFRELLDLELLRARRSNATISIVSADLDRFKQVNDRAGHVVGDATLKRVAEILQQVKRLTDGAARVGGEEFSLILPDTDHDDAFIVAERLRCAVQDAFAGASVPSTISLGIATYPQHGQTAGSLLRAADEALYAAKASGRNRTVIHSSDLAQAAGALRRDIESERFLAAMLELAEAADLRFSGSARHSETVGRYAAMTAHELGYSEPQIQRVRLAGILHDIGKIGVPDAILHKPGKLTDEEFAVIRTHPGLGAQILEHESLADIRAWVYAHHERPDGHGYPLGLTADSIALEAQILAVTDAYEAMTSDRAYRAAPGHAAARAELQRHAGTQFNERIVTAFLDVLHRESDAARTVLAAQPL